MTGGAILSAADIAAGLGASKRMPTGDCGRCGRSGWAHFSEYSELRLRTGWVRDPANGRRHFTETYYAWIPDARGGTTLVSRECTGRKAAETRGPVLDGTPWIPSHAAARALDDYAASRKPLRRAEGTLHRWR